MGCAVHELPRLDWLCVLALVLKASLWAISFDVPDLNTLDSASIRGDLLRSLPSIAMIL